MKDAIQCQQLIWGPPHAEKFSERHGLFDTVLGADVIYTADAIQPLFDTVACILKKPHGQFILSRYSKWNNVDDEVVFEAARTRGLHYCPQSSEGIHVFNWNGDKNNAKLDTAPTRRQERFLPTHQPIIKTSRLVLRPLSLFGHDVSDSLRIQQLAGDKRVALPTRNIPHPYAIEMADDWITKHPSDWWEQKSVVYAITFKPNAGDCVEDCLIGCIGLEIVSKEEAELGYWLGVPYWGRGLTSEAATEVIQVAFAEFGFQRIFAKHYLSNLASGRVMAKAGMSHVGQEQEIDRDGKLVSMEVYEIRNGSGEK